MASNFPKVFSEELSCPVCLEELKEPKCLTVCAHNVCRDCLERIATRSGDEIQCPICRRFTVLPEGGVKCLPTNTILVRLLEAIPGRREKLEILKALDRGKPVVKHMERKICDLDKSLSDLTLSLEQVEKDIHENADQIVEIIRKQEVSLCSEALDFYGKKQVVIGHQKNNLIKLHSNASNSVELAEGFMQQSDASENIDLANALVQQLEEITMLNLEESAHVTFDEELVFSMNKEGNSILQYEKFGNVKRKILKGSLNASIASSIDWSKSGEVRHRIGHKGRKRGFFRGPAAVSTNEFGEIAVCDFFNNRIQVFDGRLKFMFEFGKKGCGDGQFEGPTGVAYTCYNNIVVFDSKNCRIQIFNRNGEFVSKFGIQGTNFGEFGQSGSVSVDTSGDIIVTDTDNNRVQIFNNNGLFKLEFGGTGTEGFDKPLSTVSIDDDYFTTDSGNNCIKVFSSEGVYVGQFGREGTGPGEFCCPRGLAIDRNNRLLLVCDSDNNSVHILRLDGSCLCKFNTKKIPVGLAILQNNYILVCSYHSNCVQVLSYT